MSVRWMDRRMDGRCMCAHAGQVGERMQMYRRGQKSCGFEVCPMLEQMVMTSVKLPEINYINNVISIM